MNTCILAVLVLLGCDQGDTDTGEPVIPSGPVLVHEPTTDSVREGDELPISVQATDDDGVAEVTLYYRTWGDPVWTSLDLVGDGDVYSGTIPSESVQVSAVEYYFKATDDSEWDLVSYLPTDGQGDPFQVAVGEVGTPVPYFQDFEELGEAGQVYELGWSEYSQGFEAYTWTVREDRAYSGELAVAHRRGVDGVDSLHDWLVSPPLDLSSLSTLQVGWVEWGDYVASADHSLWISLDSPDPDDGDYELVAELPAPLEDTWDRAPVVDLSAWAGQELAYLAWVYEGQYADAWYMDDISVRELGPDLVLSELDWTHVEPGQSTTLTIDLANRTSPAAEDVALDIEVDTAWATVTDLPEIFTIDGMDSAQVQATVQVDASYSDNAYLPVTLIATVGDDTWSWDQDLVVGQVSTGHVELSLTEDGSNEAVLVELALGVGDPDDPLLSLPVAAEALEAGDHAWEVDLTSLYDWLPPAPGELRWWLRVNSGLAGTVGRFDIDFDGDTWVSDDLGAFTADEDSWFYLPRPPQPAIDASSTDPAQVAPGDAVSFTVTVVNDSADTLGLTTVELTSSDAAVTLTSAGPYTLAESGWAEGASDTLDFSFTVAADKTDSRPVDLSLVFTDEAESFVVDAEVAVPWPVLALTAVRVDDWSDGDNDGLLDPDETAKLELELTNVGDLDSFGAVYCDLSITGGTATASLADASQAYGLIPAGETEEDDDFEITVSSGSNGDDIELLLSCTDGTQSYELPTQIVLGERPWISLSAIDDDHADAVDAYTFDIVNGRYRSDGTTLQLELSSAAPYDPTTLFLEFWGLSTGADYTYYQVVIQSGAGKMRGYELGAFTTLSTFTLIEVDEDTVQADIDLASLGLTLDKLSMGFASGFCGGDDYYCDHFPDSWGNPYQSGMSTSLFVDMSW